MSNDRTDVLKRIKATFNLEGNKSNNIRLPRDIEFTIVGNDVEMHISSKSVEKNMQDDAAAFEGWALVLKRWGKFDKVILSWDLNNLPDNGHYQRFLFRATNFSKDFNSWFEIKSNCIPYLTALIINESETYYLNSPSNNRDKNIPQGAESILEDKFSKGDWADPLKLKTNADYLNRQLPVGVFKKSVSKLTSIFPRLKSAIDIWGISKNNELLLFELKAHANNKVGIITELYFYYCIMQNVQSGRFKHEKSDPDLDKIAKSKGINAYFLAPKLHLLIDKELVGLLNEKLSPDIEIQYLQFSDYADKLVLKDGFNPLNP
ncbi:MAG: hypothetical protein GZ094_00215 [Mariniphaga sp.]|nr:hypothetical protein [Mariniphaga sp.]